MLAAPKESERRFKRRVEIASPRREGKWRGAAQASNGGRGSRRKTISFMLLGLLMALGWAPPRLAAQATPYTSTPEYKVMLEALAQKAPRPSRISGAGELLQAEPPAIPVEASETPQGLRLETEFFRLEITKEPFRLALNNKVTNASWRLGATDPEVASVSWTQKVEPKGTARTTRLTKIQRIEKRGNRWILQGEVEGVIQPVSLELALITSHVILVSIDGSPLGEDASSEFRLTGQGPFFGLGEQYLKAKLDGQKFNLHPDDRPGTPGHKWDYMSIPFVFSPKGLGVFFDTAFNCVFDATTAQEEGFSFQIAGSSVDFYLIAAAGPREALETYTGLTGRSPLPPPWAFGVWHNSLQGSDAVLKDARRIREEGIPMSALWVSDLMDQSVNIGWPLWTYGYYGTTGQFSDALHKLGFKVLAYFYPYVRSLLLPYPLENPTFQQAVRDHFLVTKPNGEPIGPTFEPVQTGNLDFTNPTTVGWWEKNIQRILTVHNFDGWMEDFGEWTQDDHRFAAGKTGRVMASLNPLFYHKITYEIAHRIKPDVVEFARSGAPGSQAFTRVLWGGDQTADWSSDNGLPSVVTAGITAGLSGFAVWGPDIVSSSRSKELFIRWAQFGALSPIMRDHLWDKPQFAVDLWFDSETVDIFRRYAKLHVSLFPYFYTYAHEATKTGLPIMRHLMLEWPDDPKTYDAEYEYLLGEKILVAPVVEQGANTRRLYLPKGAWVDYWSGEIIEGGKEVEISAPLDRIPILVRAGAVLPFIDPGIETLAQDMAGNKYRTLDSSLTWRVFPSITATNDGFKLYDGSSVMVEQDPSGIRAEGKSSVVRSYEVIQSATRRPREVVLSGQPMEELDDAGYRARKKGWWLCGTDHTLHVLFVGDNFKLNVSGR